MIDTSFEKLVAENAALRNKIEEYEELFSSIQDGSIDALAIKKNGKSDIYTLESIDLAFRVLVENFAESALNITESGLIIFANKAFSNLLGITSSYLAGTYIQEYIDSKSRVRFDEMFNATLKGVNSKGEILLTYKDKSFSVYIALSSLKPSLPAIGVLITDLTEKNAAQEKLRQIDEELKVNLHELSDRNIELEQFAHIISHDLKEPLRKITLSAQKLILENDQRNGASLQHINVMRDAAFRMKNQIEDLLIYTTSLDRNNVGFDTVDLNETIISVMNDLGTSIESTHAGINVEPLPLVRGNASQLSLLFQNIFSNSIKYSRNGIPPFITVESSVISGKEIMMPGDYYHKIAIKDNGIGFDQKFANKIFGIFQRLHGKKEYSGTGLGLAICKRIVENHKGLINAESIEGEGATFTIYLPV